MTPTTVVFTGFETDSRRARRSQLTGHVPFWPQEWMIVPEKKQVDFSVAGPNYHKWTRENCMGTVEIILDPTSGRRVFAFEYDEDGILFKMTF